MEAAEFVQVVAIAGFPKGALQSREQKRQGIGIIPHMLAGTLAGAGCAVQALQLPSGRRMQVGVFKTLIVEETASST